MNERSPGENPEPSIPAPEAEEPKQKKIIGRRKFLKTGAKIAGGVAAAGALGAAYIEISAEFRSRSLEHLAEFLRGESKEKLMVFGKELDYNEFCNLVLRLADPPIGSRQALSSLLDSFIYMMEVEDDFAGHLNVLPELEHMEFIREKYLSGIFESLGMDKNTMLLADTFGPGQINPDTARQIALDKSAKLKKEGALSDDQLKELNDPNLPKYKTSEILELQAGGNVVLSFLSFYEGYNFYGRSTGGQIHGGLQLPERRGRLQPVRQENPRAFSLAVTAYSAGLESAMVAKAQTYYNELVLTDTDFSRSVGGKILPVDGDLGSDTQNALEQASKYINQPAPDLNMLKQNTNSQILAIDNWLRDSRQAWRESLAHFLSEESIDDPETRQRMRSMIAGRYSLQIYTYRLLKRHMDPAVAKELLLEYMDQRSGKFLDVISDADEFKKYAAGRDHAGFLKELHRSLRGLVDFDERYKGYIPTNFRMASQPGADKR